MTRSGYVGKYISDQRIDQMDYATQAGPSVDVISLASSYLFNLPDRARLARTLCWRKRGRFFAVEII